MYVQSNEVHGSSKMEKEGFIRGLNIFDDHNLEIGLLVTNRHRPPLSKWIRENRPDINHKYDVWHVAKSKACT